jgi:hypothetical protein
MRSDKIIGPYRYKTSASLAYSMGSVDRGFSPLHFPFMRWCSAFFRDHRFNRPTMPLAAARSRTSPFTARPSFVFRAAFRQAVLSEHWKHSGGDSLKPLSPTGNTIRKIPKQSFLSKSIGLIHFGFPNSELDNTLVCPYLEHAQSWSCLYNIRRYMERANYSPDPPPLTMNTLPPIIQLDGKT